MSKILVVVVLAALVAPCFGQQARGANSKFPLGAYKIRSSEFDFYANGTYKIFDPNPVLVLGRYKIDGNVITMTNVRGQYVCKGENPGKYHWTYDGTSIKLSLIQDRCKLRRTRMSESPFQKLGHASMGVSTHFPLGAYEVGRFGLQLDYYANGTFEIFDPNPLDVLGHYKIDGNVITMTNIGGQYGCKANTNPAKYHWTSNGKSIKLSLIEDRCKARKTAMSESPFPRLSK